MAVYFQTSDPAGLLRKFRSAIDQTSPEGKITTWTASKDGNYYTHTSKQWGYSAWMKPVVETQRLTFYIIKSKGSVVSQTAYGFYHGHMIETFLNHFDRLFDHSSATAMPVPGDLISS